MLTADANAWSTGVQWGATTAPDGQPITWGVKDGQPWGPSGPDITRNTVWGTLCAGADCAIPWNAIVVGTERHRRRHGRVGHQRHRR